MSDTAILLTIENMQTFLHDALEGAHTSRLTITWRPAPGEETSGEHDLYDLRWREGAYEIFRQALFAPIDGEVEWQPLPATSMKRAGSGNPMDSWDDTYRIAVAECNGHTILFYQGTPTPAYTFTLLQRFVRNNWPGGEQPAVLNIITSTPEGNITEVLKVASNLLYVYVLDRAKHVNADGTATEWQGLDSEVLGKDSGHGGWHSGATCMTFSLGDASTTFSPPQAKAA